MVGQGVFLAVSSRSMEGMTALLWVEAAGGVLLHVLLPLWPLPARHGGDVLQTAAPPAPRAGVSRRP